MIRATESGTGRFGKVNHRAAEFTFGLSTVLLSFVLISPQALAQANKSRMFGEGSPFGADDLPPGLLRSQFDSLPPQAKARARHWLESFAFPEQDLGSIHLDEEGGVFYVDSTIIGSAPGASQAAQDPAAQLEEISASELFALHSKPGASHVVHLDFDGHTIAGTRWNSEAGVDHLYALPYDTNGNTASFSAAELNDMAAIWHRVAEDFAPFNIDVTTEAPAGGYGPNVGHVLITHRYDSNGSAIYPSSAGGVAYVGVWGRSDYSEYQPALVFYNHLGGGDVHNVAEASSHELGHNLNLSHDGSDSTNYYTGHGSGNTGWAPIMGVGYYKNVTQWSEGEYSGANNTQNDISIITDYLGLSPDDHGDELSAATALAVQADGSVVVTDPESDPDNASPANKGIIEHRNDSDYFYFDTTGGDVNLSVRPAWQAWDYESYRGADLDARAFLYDAYGNLIDQYDSASDTQVSIGASLVEGRYFVRVSGHSSSHYSDYGSLGQYFISGSIAGASTGSANLISNAGFESDFQSWVDWGNSFIETGSVHSGARSARIGPSAGGRAQRLSNLVAGKQYTLCAWSRVDSLESPASSYMGVDIYAADDTRLANNQWNVAWTTWQQNSLTFTYPSNADYVNVWVWSEDASGATYVDDFDLVEGAVCEGTGGNAAPGANFSVALSTMTATFTDTSADSDGDIVSWHWDFGDGESSSEQHPSHSYQAEGDYQVALTVTDDQGASNTASKTVTVSTALLSNEIMTWVPHYSLSTYRAMANIDLGACDPKDGLTRVGLQFWIPNSDGSIRYQTQHGNPNDSEVAWWRSWCSANGIDCLLTVYNNNGSWNWPLAVSAFKDNRSTFVNALVAEMERLGLDGVDIDLEGGTYDDLPAETKAAQREAFSGFIQDLSLALRSRGKILTVNSFPYIWNAPNTDWWEDWAGYVDNIHSMGYDQLYEGGSGWQKYSWQQNTGFAAGFDGGDVLMGMPAWDATHDQWGTSSGRGTSAQAHVKEVRYDLNGSTGIAIWDMQFNGWDDPDLWCEIKELKGTSTQNAAPLAADDEVSGSEDSVIMLDVLANDSDADGDPLIIISLTGATYGTAVIEGATVRYTPNLDFNGSDSFGYTIADGNGGVASATIFVTVTAVNDLPVANDDSASTRGTDAVTIDVIANDSDVDGDSLTITGTSVPTHGAVSHTGTSISYIADESFSGNDSFIYTVSDGAATASATVTVAVAGTQLVSVDSLSGAASGGKKRWNASVTTRVSPPLAGVTIQGNWSIGGAHSCVTDGDGRCSGSVSLREGSVTYSVTALGGEGFEYHAGLNEMPEITVHKDGSVGYPGINQQPGADFSHSADGLNVQFTDTSTDLDGSIISRLWNFGNGNTSTAQHPAHDYEQAGTYTVTLTVNDDGGESDSMSHSVVVSGEPPADMAVHLGELSATVSGNKRWTTTVTIPVHTGGESGKAGVTASGSWSDGASGSCQTDLNGVCSLSRSTKAGSMVFTLNGLAGNGVDYQFESNHGNVTITTVKP